MVSRMTDMSLPVLCTSAYYGEIDGYNYQYASFSGTHDVFANGPPIWYSKLVDATYDDDEPIRLPDGRPMKIPQWYDWETINEFGVEHSGTYNVNFIVPDMSRIVSHEDGLLMDTPPYYVDTLLIWNPSCIDKFTSFKHSNGSLWTYCV